MIAGIELFALGVEQVVGHVDEPLKPEASAALFGGVGAVPARPCRLQAAQRRLVRPPARWSRRWLCAAAVPLGTEIDALAALALVAAIVTR